jgi:LPXTG-motif cell wall-anchored protein
MNETLASDTIQKSYGIISDVSSTNNESVSIWLWIALIELLIIIFLLFLRKRKKELSKKELFRKDSKEQKIDFDNIINSSFHAQSLYDELIIRCHPDRFPTDFEKNKIALELFQEITENKTDYKKLIELRELAEVKLNIKF